MKVLVLGHKGMLGHMVHKYLSTKNDCELITTDLRWPSQEFRTFVVNFDGDYVINCIGAIHQRTNDFSVNEDLPIWLESGIFNKSFKIIHPGTDCEMDSDEYGSSKRHAAEYILKEGTDTTIIKTSIIGPELDTKASLLEWFLNVEDESIDGYSEYYWNGNTTLQWAKICYKIMRDYYRYDTLNIPVSKCISKYELLNIMKSIFEKEITINKDSSIKFNKCLQVTHDMPDENIEAQLKELKEFYYDN